LALIQQMAVQIAQETGHRVSAQARVSFNGRVGMTYTDPTVDLTSGPVAAGHWVVPLP
jgi:hypothetical protein